MLFECGGLAPNWSLRRNINLAVASHSILHHYEQCTWVCQGALLTSLLRYTEQSCEYAACYKKYNRQCPHWASYIFSSHRGVPGGSKSATACITSLRVAGNNDFNLAVSTQTTKPPNLIPQSFSWMISCNIQPGNQYTCINTVKCMKWHALENNFSCKMHLC